MALVRSMHAHAEIVDIDTSEAEDHPECELVLTAEDVKEQYNPMPTGIPEVETDDGVEPSRSGRSPATSRGSSANLSPPCSRRTGTLPRTPLT